MSVRLALTSAATALAAAAIAGCAGQARVDYTKAGLARVDVNVLAISNVAPLYLGKEKGFFRDEGIDMTPSVSQGGATTITAVVSGDSQFGYTTGVSESQAAAKGLPLRAVSAAAVASSRPQDDFAGLMVRPGGPVRTPADLAGKKIAVNGLQSVNQVTIDAALRKRGVDVSKITYVEVPLAGMGAALRAGRVAAIDVVEPFVSINRAQGARSLLDNYREADPGGLIGAYFTTDQFVRRYPDVVRRFQRAMVRSQRYAQAHPEEARAVITTYTKTSAKNARTMVLPQWSTRLVPDDLLRVARMTQQAGVLGSSRLPDPRRMLWPSGGIS